MSRRIKSIDALRLATDNKSASSASQSSSPNLVFGKKSLSLPSRLIREATKLADEENNPKDPDPDAIRALAHVFQSSLASFFHCMDELPLYVTSDLQYLIGQWSVDQAKFLFVLHSTTLATIEDPTKLREATTLSSQLFENIMSHLDVFLEVAVRLVSDKPLPPVPQEDPVASRPSSIDSMGTDFSLLTASDTETLFERKDESPFGEKKEGSIMTRLVRSRTQSSTALRLKDAIHSLSRKKTPSFQPLLAIKLQNLSDVVPPEPVDRSLPDIPYLVRMSQIYPTSERLPSDLDVEMPMPIGDSVAVALDDSGGIRAVSCTALIRMLTSDESSDELADIFLHVFRCSIPPTELVSAIVERCIQKPPVNLNADQLRVWAHTTSRVHKDSAKLILLWIDRYWNSALDNVIISPLRLFIQMQFPASLGQEDMAKLLKSLEDAEQGKKSRKAWLDDHIAHLDVLAAPLRTVYEDIALERILDLRELNGRSGKETLARQLTLSLFRLYLNLDLHEMVRWRLGGTSVHTEDTQARYQEMIDWTRSMGLWVTSSIIHSSPEFRFKMTELWIDTADICVAMNNLAGAEAIWTGLTSSPVLRLRETFRGLCLKRKHRLRPLRDLFEGENNNIVYTQLLQDIERAHVPFIPILPHFLGSLDRMKVYKPTATYQDGNKAIEVINWNGYKSLASGIRSLELAKRPYNYKMNQYFQDWITTNLNKYDLKDEKAIVGRLYDASLQIEPRPKERPDDLDPYMWFKSFCDAHADPLPPSHPFRRASSKLAPKGPLISVN
ncbi:ras guanine nucleotide exchange factor domain-containing protein [Mycena floridula]|nr:ras guanine nucleotide exchange factor domain-containing protein [Mycena floridula]